MGAEAELRQFLDGQPSWRRKWLLWDTAMTRDEADAWFKSDASENSRRRKEFEALIKRVPSRWRAYLEKRRQNALLGIPENPTGRPRKDDLADEALALHNSGLSHARVARELNRIHGPETTSRERVRKLLSSRKKLK